MASRLPNYLKTYRKRAGFSQDEVAFLLGCASGAKVSRYERRSRQPGLETALGYKALFGTAVDELFAGLSEKVESEVVKRARILGERLSTAEADRSVTRKLQSLAALAARLESGAYHNAAYPT